MGRRIEFSVTLEMSAMVTVPVVVAGITYYRHALGQFGGTLPLGRFNQLAWHPGVSHVPVDADGVLVATVGAGVQLAPVKLGIWLVPVAGVDVTPGAVTPASRAPIILSPGNAIDLGGWEGDLLLLEGARGGNPGPGPEPYSFVSAPFQVACGPSLTFVLDNAVRYIAGAPVTAGS